MTLKSWTTKLFWSNNCVVTLKSVTTCPPGESNTLPRNSWKGCPADYVTEDKGTGSDKLERHSERFGSLKNLGVWSSRKWDHPRTEKYITYCTAHPDGITRWTPKALLALRQRRLIISLICLDLQCSETKCIYSLQEFL